MIGPHDPSNGIPKLSKHFKAIGVNNHKLELYSLVSSQHCRDACSHHTAGMPN